MGSEYISLGPVPSDEDCIQVGTDNYESLGRKESNDYIDLLNDRYSDFDLVYFRIHRDSHDFGYYYDVCVHYDDVDRESLDQALFIERTLPRKWTDKEIFSKDSDEFKTYKGEIEVEE